MKLVRLFPTGSRRPGVTGRAVIAEKGRRKWRCSLAIMPLVNVLSAYRFSLRRRRLDDVLRVAWPLLVFDALMSSRRRI